MGSHSRPRRNGRARANSSARERTLKIYTRGGDRGETSLLRGGRVPKNNPHIEAYGTVDELNSIIGLVRAVWPNAPLDSELEQIQRDLFDIGALLSATGSDPRFPGAAASRIEELEQSIDRMEAELDPLRDFILPGGSAAAAQLHVARSVCRRCERLVVALQQTELIVGAIRFLNRLSDYLFVAARFANRRLDVPDILWKP